MSGIFARSAAEVAALISGCASMPNRDRRLNNHLTLSEPSNFLDISPTTNEDNALQACEAMLKTDPNHLGALETSGQTGANGKAELNAAQRPVDSDHLLHIILRLAIGRNAAVLPYCARAGVISRQGENERLILLARAALIVIQVVSNEAHRAVKV